MAMDIAALRAAFAKKESEGSGSEGNTGFWDKFFPFYKMDFDSTVEFRFLPDLDEENPLGFIVENKYHELLINGKKKRIACLKMYGEQCPCCDKSQEHYNGGDIDLGKKFWRKIDYVAQGLVIQTPFEYPMKAEENPVRMISLGPKLYKVIEAKIVKGDLEEMPYDMISGYNFKIYKTHQGEYADYSTSDFARKSTGIPDNLLANLELYDLKNFRYAKIEREQMEAIIEAFLTGRSYEEEKTAAASAGANTGNANLDAQLAAGKPVQAAASVVEQAQAATPATPATPAPATAKLSPQEILAKLKARQPV
jgi:hypothetical protein